MPLALTRGRDGHAPQVLIARRGNEAEIFPHFLIHFFFRHANAGGRSEIEHANLSAITDNGNLIDGNLLIAFDQNLPLINTEQSSGGALRSAVHLQACPAQRVEKLRGGRVFAYRKMQRPETPFERSIRVVADAGYPSLTEVEHGKGLQNIVQLRGSEIYVDVLAVTHVARVLKVTDPIFVKNYASHRQTRCGIVRYRRIWRLG